LIFKYRSVEYGAAFSRGAGNRDSGATVIHDPLVLYENEVAVNVGRCCFACAGQPLNVIDHRSGADVRYGSAAVLIHAQKIVERLTGKSPSVIWLVTRDKPDFDAFVAMYLLRSIIDGSLCSIPRFDGAELEVGSGNQRLEEFFSNVRRRDNRFVDLFPDARWALILARYACHVSAGRAVQVARQRALHSVLRAAVERGRPELTVTGGFTLFTEARSAIQAGKDPLFDVVLDLQGEFSSEFALLEGESAAYDRDMLRARKSIVFVPTATDFANEYSTLKREPLLDEQGSLLPGAMGSLEVAPRAQFDAVYLRDPECLLFREWVQGDIQDSSLGLGFTFMFIAYSEDRPKALVNSTRYIISLNAERAGDARLYNVWCRLQQAEAQARWKQALSGRQSEATLQQNARAGFEARAGTHPGLFADPWYEASASEGRRIATPKDGSLIGPPGQLSDCLDDPVADIVRSELEEWIFADDGKWDDLSASEPRLSDISGEQVANSEHDRGKRTFRFGHVRLKSELGSAPAAAVKQISTKLWTKLHPEEPLSHTPADLAAHTVHRAGIVGVWSRAGVFVAYTQTEKDWASEAEEVFREIVNCANHIDRLTKRMARIPVDRSTNGRLRDPSVEQELRYRVGEAEKITLTLAETRNALANTGGELLEKFLKATGLDALSANLRDITLAANNEMQNQTTQEFARVGVEVQQKLEWIELLFVGIYATELANILAERALPTRFQLLSIMLVAATITAIAGQFLKPWKRGGAGVDGKWVVIAFASILAAGIIIGAIKALAPA
jgi:hypothetical protein